MFPPPHLTPPPNNQAMQQTEYKEGRKGRRHGEGCGGGERGTETDRKKRMEEGEGKRLAQGHRRKERETVRYK